MPLSNEFVEEEIERNKKKIGTNKNWKRIRPKLMGCNRSGWKREGYSSE